MKDLKISKLNDLYGVMLTEKQREVITQYYDLDYSLSEIAENFRVSRQGIHCTLKQGVDALLSYESKLNFLSKIQQIEDLVEKAKTKENLAEIFLELDKINEITRS